MMASERRSHPHVAEWATIVAGDEERRKRAMANPRSADAQREANATPETLRHKQASVIDSMHARGALRPEQVRAAHEIARIWSAMAEALGTRVQEYEPRIRGGQTNDDWRAGLILAYHERYIPWRAEAGAQRAGGGKTVFDLVVAVAVDNYGFVQTAEMHRMDHRSVKDKVRMSLLRYAQIGGWVDHLGKSIRGA